MFWFLVFGFDFVIFSDDTHLAFKYAIIRGHGSSTAKVLLRHRWDGVLDRGGNGDNVLRYRLLPSRGILLLISWISGNICFTPYDRHTSSGSLRIYEFDPVPNFCPPCLDFA